MLSNLEFWMLVRVIDRRLSPGGMFNVFTSGSPDIKISINGKEINLRDEEEKKDILENNTRGLGKEE